MQLSVVKYTHMVVVVMQSSTWGLGVAYMNGQGKSFCGRPLTNRTHKMRVSTKISGYIIIVNLTTTDWVENFHINLQILYLDLVSLTE